MKKIDQLTKDDKNITFCAIMSKKEKRKFNNKNGNFLELEFTDSTGSISGKKWDNIELLDIYNEGDVLEVTGTVNEYKGTKQIILEKAIKLKNIDPSLFIPSFDQLEIDNSINYIKEIFKSIKNKDISSLWKYFMNSDIYLEFIKAPAAKGFHHNKLGGLVVHTSQVMRLCENISKCYELDDEDFELLMTGALFHDIGKIKEYVYETCIDISDEGRLLGHITIGNLMLEDIFKQIQGFPKKFSIAIKHMILSHHGEYEWGSPKKPKTVLAIILHFADNLDSRVEGIKMISQEALKDGNKWTKRFDGRPFLIDLGVFEEENSTKNNHEQELF